MNRVKINLILINLFFLFFFNNILKAESNFYIVAKVDNEIINLFYQQYSKIIPFIGKYIIGSSKPYDY